MIFALMKTKLPFEPNTLAQVAATGAIGDDDFIDKALALNKQGLDYFLGELKPYEEKGLFKIVPTYANFLMLDMFSEEKVTDINQKLLRQGVIIRPLKAFGLGNCLRITMGLMKENEAFIREFKKLI